jgi:hypothetical protein
MSMDLTVKCPHCGAGKGKLCKPTCGVNGSKVEKAINSLHALGLELDNVHLNSGTGSRDDVERR